MKPDPATLSRWPWHYRMLSRLRDTLVRELAEHDAAFRQPIGENAEDAVELAEERREHAELLAELRLEEAELAEVEAALERIRHGTYGLCAATGDPISPARLRAIPWTRYSTEAAQRLEHARAALLA